MRSGLACRGPDDARLAAARIRREPEDAVAELGGRAEELAIGNRELNRAREAIAGRGIDGIRAAGLQHAGGDGEPVGRHEARPHLRDRPRDREMRPRRVAIASAMTLWCRRLRSSNCQPADVVNPSSHAAPCRKPEWTRRRRVGLVRLERDPIATRAGVTRAEDDRPPSASYGRACSSISRRSCPGCQASMRIVPLHDSPHDQVIEPPSPGSTRASSGNQRTSSPACVSAFHTSAGEALTSMVMSKARGLSLPVMSAPSSVVRVAAIRPGDGIDRGMNRGDEPEPAPARGVLVVVFRGERGDAVRQLPGERRAALGVREVDHVEREGRSRLPLAGRGRRAWRRRARPAAVMSTTR